MHQAGASRAFASRARAARFMATGAAARAAVHKTSTFSAERRMKRASPAVRIFSIAGEQTDGDGGTGRRNGGMYACAQNKHHGVSGSVEMVQRQ